MLQNLICYICDTLYPFLFKYKELQNNYKKENNKNYKHYTLEEVKISMVS